MPRFGQKSLQQMETLHKDLKFILDYAIKFVDFSVIEGYRSPERQLTLYWEGKSRTQNSKHNLTPARAVDLAPYPMPKAKRAQDIAYSRLAGVIQCVAYVMHIPLVWGGSWHSGISNNDFFDLGHFELGSKAGVPDED